MPADPSTGRKLNRSHGLIALGRASVLRLRPGRVLPVLLCLAALAGLAALTHPALAQTPQPREPEYVYEAQTRARWLHGRQQARFTRFNEHTYWIQVDSLDASATGVRTMQLLLGGSSGDTARVRFDAQGRVVDTDVMLRALPERVMQRPGARERSLRTRLFSGGGDRALPEMRIRALVPRFPDATPSAGMQWTDTVDVVVERNGIRQEVHGVRVSTVAGDTTLDGRTMWIVADSAVIRYAEQWLREERTLDTLVVVARMAAGTIRGTHIHDPQTGLYRVRHDTTSLEGIAELRYPDDRTFRTPARYERTRRTERHTPAAYADRRAELRAQSDAHWRGMVLLPANEIEERLAERDTALRDSLVRAWHTAQNAEERGRLALLLAQRGDWERDFGERMNRMALEAGDTTQFIERLTDRLNHSDPFDADVIRAVLPFMEDPGLAFALGLRTDPFYENPRQALLLAPPALVDDTTDWPCTPEACGLLAAQTDAREPRLRGLAHIAQFVLAPARYADDIEMAAAQGAVFVQPALAMARGALVNWPMIDARSALPGQSDDWRAWLHWMNPRPPWRAADTTSSELHVSFDTHAANTLRVHELVTGRDVTAEIRTRLEEATSDSARLVYGVMLMRLDGDAPDPAMVAAHFRAGSEPLRTLAQLQLRHLFPDAQPWTADTAATLVDRLLGVLIEDAEPWPQLVPDSRGNRIGAIGPGGHRPDRGPVFLLSDSLPPQVADAWRMRVMLISRAEWKARSPRLPGILFQTDDVHRIGPFVRVRASYVSRYARAPDQAPEAYAGGAAVTLMQTDAGWVIVDVTRWAT